MSLIVGLRGTVALEDKQKAIRKEQKFSINPAGSQIFGEGGTGPNTPPYH